MKQLKATIDSGNGIMLLKLNGRNILKNSGTTTINLKDGETYILQWYVDSQQGARYSLKITSPAEAEVDITRTLKHSGRDYGGFSFKA